MIYLSKINMFKKIFQEINFKAYINIFYKNKKQEKKTKS